MSKYNNSNIYKICCLDKNIKDLYIGSCIDFSRRKREHKYNCNNAMSKKYNYCVYKKIRENGGWNNFEMIKILSFSCNSRQEKEKKERDYINLLNPTLNKNIPMRTLKEYRIDNRDNILLKQKIYDKRRRETIKLFKALPY